MQQTIKKIRSYRARLGTLQLIKLLGLIILAKLLARKFSSLSAKWSFQKLTLPIVSHPVFIRIGTTDVEVLQQVLLDHEYEFTLPITPAVIIDAGANIGFASVYFANKYPDARIIALEPDPSNFKLLQMNTVAYPQIKALNMALWNESKPINLFSPQGGHSGFRTLEKSDDSLQHYGKTDAITIDDLLQQYKLDFIDILKMDIEGAEREVFQSSANWINQVKVFMVELHESYKPGCTEAFNTAVAGFQPIITQKGETLLCLRGAPARLK
ncbi:MAG TPA: FkbM family methyltransferase [Verrucomicrobiae bacterium]|jgi:FkbM family methyltransferase